MIKLVPQETDVVRLAELRNTLAEALNYITMHHTHLTRWREKWTAAADEARQLEETFERRRRARLRDEMPVMAAPITFELVEDEHAISKNCNISAGLPVEQGTGGIVGEPGRTRVQTVSTTCAAPAA